MQEHDKNEQKRATRSATNAGQLGDYTADQAMAEEDHHSGDNDGMQNPEEEQNF